VEIGELRGEFPVVARVAYLNAGTDGPLPARAVRAGCAELERELADGRTLAHFERRFELGRLLREGYARVLGCETADASLTTSTTEGITQVLAGLELQAGSEILTSDEEHPGLLGPLGAAREACGVTIREVPLERIAAEVGPRTALVACSHVGWVSGSLAPAELRDCEVPVLLDGAQGPGAVPLDMRELGCAAYAAAGQKWLCGPDGTGVLYTTPELRGRLTVRRRGYVNLLDPNAGVEAHLHEDARCLDTLALSAETLAVALSSLELLEQVGLDRVCSNARERALELCGLLERAGREIAPRGETTLVSFTSEDPEGERDRLREAGVVLRNIPGRPWLRASVGAWNDAGDLQRLVGALERR